MLNPLSVAEEAGGTVATLHPPAGADGYSLSISPLIFSR